MKCFFIVALLCASLCSFGQDTRTVTYCGYNYNQASDLLPMMSYLRNADEEVVPNSGQITANGSNYCISMTFRCVPGLTKSEEVPDVAKVIQFQECKLIETE